MTSKERRIELHQLLSHIPGVQRAYFQPPASIKMVYPCIRYSREGTDDLNADDLKYVGFRRYNLVVIDPDPDTDIPDLLLKSFNQIRFNRTYTANNLNHYVFTLYF